MIFQQFAGCYFAEDGAGESILEKFSTDLTQKAKDDELDPMIGREEEIGAVDAGIVQEVQK